MGRSKPSIVGAVLAVLALAPGSAAGQDLYDRLRTAESPEDLTYVNRYRGRDRLDLRVGGTYPTAQVLGDRGYARIGLDQVISSDFACGRFDLRANLKSVLGKEARDDFVETLIGAVESELMYNALVLACEISPTACQAFQHFRTNANALLGIGYDRCAAVEAGIRDGLTSARAQSIKDCVERKRQGGVEDPNQALAACERENHVSGLLGDRTEEFDLGRELEKVFELDPGTSQDLQVLLSKIRITPRGVAGEVRADAVLQEYRTIEREYLRAWTDATNTLAGDPGTTLDPELARKLRPKGLPGVLPVEARQVAQIPAPKREIYIRKLASEAAMVDLTMRVQDLERRLAAMANLPQNTEGRVRQIEQTIRDLRLQLRHLQELALAVSKYNQALLGFTASGKAHENRRAARSLARAKSQEFRLRTEDLARPWGARRSGTPGAATSPHPSARRGVVTPSRSVNGRSPSPSPIQFGGTGR